MRIAWLLPLVLLGLSACVNETPAPTPAATIVQPVTPAAPAVMASPGTTVITRP